MSDPGKGENLFERLRKAQEAKEPQKPPPASESSPPQPTSEPKRRGRPATGKRSDPNWIGRTYYVRKSTDLDVEDELLQLKRQGVEVDKSELVDALLAAWVKWRNGDNANSLLAEISPRRNSEKSEPEE